MKVKLYDDCSHKITFSNLKFLDSGACGTVYRLDKERVLKYITDGYFYDVNVFQRICCMNLANFGYVYQLLFGQNGSFSGYVMQYYEQKITNILTTKMEYTLENLYQIRESFKRLTEAGILVIDLHDKNVILEDNIIRIIDFDGYKYANYDFMTLELYNFQSIMYLFRCLYFTALLDHYEFTEERREKVNNLFSYEGSFDDVVKTLKKYKYPVDYVK